MASNSTLYKAELSVSDIDRHYYATHDLVLAQHPSEPERRVMARVLVFALFAHERLEFGRRLSTSDEPDLWRRDLTGSVEQWIELGQPDDAHVRKAAGIAKEVVIVNYRGNSAAMWWKKNAAVLSKSDNLRVMELDSASLDEASKFLERRMTLTVTIQDGDCQLSDGTDCVAIHSHFRSSAD